mmetsp:Transcript_58214/g.155027  ORF Transcript_58214/g.155027 Transcript_58214/m.155027 type:complete len:97 (+) Transcript_58214:872-1162(+)
MTTILSKTQRTWSANVETSLCNTAVWSKIMPRKNPGHHKYGQVVEKPLARSWNAIPVAGGRCTVSPQSDRNDRLRNNEMKTLSLTLSHPARTERLK